MSKLNDLLGTIIKVKDLLANVGSATSSDDEQEKILLISVEELRRKCAELTADFDQLRNKSLAFIAGELALVAFLFASGMIVPHIIYGIFFFLVGVGCVAGSFTILALTLRGADWHSPGPSVAPHEETYVTALKNVCQDYTGALKNNSPIFDQRSKMFDNALMLLFIGVTILLAIKYGQGEILWRNIIQK